MSSNAINWDSLESDFEKYKAENPQARIYNISKALEVPEAALFYKGLGLNESLPIALEATTLIPRLKELGTVMSIVRNDGAVHEKIGQYETVNLHEGPKMATVLGSIIDQRIFYSSWDSAYRFKMNGRAGELEGVAIFDIHGDAVMKFYKKDDTDNKAWDDLFQTVPANGTPEFQPRKPQHNRFDSGKKEEFLEAWKNLKDTHDFFMLLMRYGITRTKALEVAEGSFAYKMHNEASVDLLSRVSKAGMPLMVFIGNKGIIQIHDGIIDKNFTQGGWLNIMDPEFNMHLDMAKVAECWHVVKPTVDGDVNSVELYDSEGELLVTFFSSRKPGTPEREIWRTIIEEIKTNQKELSNA